jgi:hypothetical protein
MFFMVPFYFPFFPCPISLHYRDRIKTIAIRWTPCYTDFSQNTTHDSGMET